jgi:hypothetical protein
MKLKFVLSLLSFCIIGNAYAGFNESYKALQAKDYQTGMTEARKGAEAGDARAFYLLGIIYHDGLGVAANPKEAVYWFDKAVAGGMPAASVQLAWAYLRGEGVTKDADKALVYARQAAKADVAEGMFLVYICLIQGPLSQLDTNGRSSDEKYKALSARPVTERTIDTEAYDALYRSAEKGFPQAMLSLAAQFGGVLGDGNRKRLQDLTAKASLQKIPAVASYEKLSRDIDALGQSYTTPQLFKDTYQTQLIAAEAKACGFNAAQLRDKAMPVKLDSITISQPGQLMVTLPITHTMHLVIGVNAVHAKISTRPRQPHTYLA